MAHARTNRRKRLAAFLHVSDMHIGRLNPLNGDAEMSWPAVKAYSNMPWLDGLIGHHGKALEELVHLLAELQESNPDLRLIVSGDLSRFGGMQELTLARHFLEDEVASQCRVIAPHLSRRRSARMAGRRVRTDRRRIPPPAVPDPSVPLP
ncbi:MAG: hypothetical protein V4693_12920 [Pseudomonadota bacterium]